MEDIEKVCEMFKDAKFGDKYITKEGFTAVYIACDDKDFNSHPHQLMVSDTKKVHYYNDFGSVMVKYNPIEADLYNIKNKVKSLETVAKQLRDEKHIGISVDILGEQQINGEKVFLYGCFITNIEDYVENPNKGYKIFNTYEDALSAGIDKAFELINQNNNENEKEIQS